MNTKAWIIVGIVILALTGGAIFALTANKTTSVPNNAGIEETTAMKKKEAAKPTPQAPEKTGTGMAEKVDVAMRAGSYEPYGPEKTANAGNGKVILFFRASWCPTCRTLDADIRKNQAAIPAGVTILDVNYDDSVPLRQKYGVTYQHTLVQVDAMGNQIVKWTGSPSLADLLSKIK